MVIFWNHGLLGQVVELPSCVVVQLEDLPDVEELLAGLFRGM